MMSILHAAAGTWAMTQDPAAAAAPAATAADAADLPARAAAQIHPLLSPFADWIQANPVTSALAVAVAVLLFGEVLHRIVRHYILRFLEGVARESRHAWDHALFEARLPQRLAWGVPLLIWQLGVDLVPHLSPDVLLVIKRVILATMVVVLVRAFAALLDGVNRIYVLRPRAAERPIKGFLQVAVVVAHLAAVIFVIAILMDRNPTIFLSGLGAMTAVLLLIFRDTLLSLVAGVQITTNDLLRVGDWIEMPQFQADGDVVDIALNSVTVQNWDRTLSVIPTHKFLEHSFKNWRGMTESGGRRIKRAIHIDLSTIRYLDAEEVERFGRWQLLRNYVAGKRQEIEAYNREHPATGDLVPHVRRLTNVGTFRAYLIEYLRAHEQLRQDMILLVRQLAPGPQGLPMELYVFTSDIGWVGHESIQADIFDHVLATVGEFGLRVYQQPGGADVQRALAGGQEAAHPG
jgi:miniconductance mechanosensitive channel